MIGASMHDLAHGWRLAGETAASEDLVRDFIEPAVDAVPPTMAARVGPCVISLGLDDPEAASRWTLAETGLEIALATGGIEPHDVAMEMLVCLGQVLWDALAAAERDRFLGLLAAEMDAGVTGEIDEGALEEKRRLLSSATLARSPRRLLRYAAVSFASTAAEYAHSLWHDVTIRTGPEHLPAPWLRKRLELLASWFPPGAGYALLA
ncbi:MAG: hypothetical protein KIT09_22140 [Bryobacteraceae bacterium]|nr:hypothetical protein [Bryobacteraceae bacterium]